MFTIVMVKLSIHLSVVTISATLVVFFLGFDFIWLYGLLIPLAWARLYREKHTIVEVLTGIAVSLLVTFITIQSFLAVS